MGWIEDFNNWWDRQIGGEWTEPFGPHPGEQLREERAGTLQNWSQGLLPIESINVYAESLIEYLQLDPAVHPQRPLTWDDVWEIEFFILMFFPLPKVKFLRPFKFGTGGLIKVPVLTGNKLAFYKAVIKAAKSPNPAYEAMLWLTKRLRKFGIELFPLSSKLGERLLFAARAATNLPGITKTQKFILAIKLFTLERIATNIMRWYPTLGGLYVNKLFLRLELELINFSKGLIPFDFLAFKIDELIRWGWPFIPPGLPELPEIPETKPPEPKDDKFIKDGEPITTEMPTKEDRKAAFRAGAQAGREAGKPGSEAYKKAFRAAYKSRYGEKKQRKGSRKPMGDGETSEYGGLWRSNSPYGLLSDLLDLNSSQSNAGNVN